MALIHLLPSGLSNWSGSTGAIALNIITEYWEILAKMYGRGAL